MADHPPFNPFRLVRSLASRIFGLFVLAVFLSGAGCGGDNPAQTPETSDPGFTEGQQLERQGRQQEALATYLKVIARRGDQAPESQLNVGLLYLEHFKDPIMAIYYFRKYVELEPNSETAGRVRELIETAKRDFAKTLPIQPPENQIGRLDTVEQLERLQQENDRLRAELAAIRVGGNVPPPVSRPPANPNAEMGWRPTVAPDDVPVIAETASAAPAVAAAPSAAPATASRGTRTHTVQKGETLYNLAARYYGKGSRWPEIVAANKDQLSGSDPRVKPGMVLKIP
jgi:tetratricopeptide (TPR) repeat protein